MPIIDLADNFQRGDTTSGLGVTSTGQKPWRLDSGSSRISGGQALVSGVSSVDVEVPDVEVSATLSENAFVAFRVVDASNYWRWRANATTTTSQVPQYKTEYEWTYTTTRTEGYYECVYKHLNHSASGVVALADMRVTRFFYEPLPDTVQVFHRHVWDDGTDAGSYTSAYSREKQTLLSTRTVETGTATGWGTFDAPYATNVRNARKTGVTRQTLTGYTTVTSISYSLRMERISGGSIALFKQVAVNSLTPSVRVVSRADGTAIFYQGASELHRTLDATFATATRVGIGAMDSARLVDNFVATPLLKPPTAPSNLSPNGSAPVDLTSAVRLSWQHNDADPQRSYSLSLRPVGSLEWTVLTGGAEQYRDLPPGALVPGQYEWEVTTTDTTSLSSPPSARAFFVANIPPGTPTITSPTGGVVNGSSHRVTWSASVQEAYQLRISADSQGTPGQVLLDTGTVTEPGTRHRDTQHPQNGRVEHVQVRVLSGGLWSGWGSARYTVSYTPPSPPEGWVDVGGPWMRVLLSNPAPSGAQPAVARNELFRRQRGSLDPVGLRVAVDLPPNANWSDPHLAHLEDVEYRAVVFGVNGSQASSGWFDRLYVAPSPDSSDVFLDEDFAMADFRDTADGGDGGGGGGGGGSDPDTPITDPTVYAAEWPTSY